MVERPADAAVSTCDIVRGIQHIEGVLKTSDGLVLIYDLDRFFSPEEEKSLDLVQCCVLDGTNKSDGFWVRARRKPQRYPQVSRGFATPPWRERRGFMFQIACNTALALERG